MQLIPLTGPFAHREGKAYEADLSDFADTGDDSQQPRRSRLMVYEDGEPIGFAHQNHADIEKYGAGR